MTTVTDIKGRKIDFDAAVMLMDDEIREALNERISDPQKFLEEYARLHTEKFDEEFAPYVGGAW